MNYVFKAISFSNQVLILLRHLAEKSKFCWTVNRGVCTPWRSPHSYHKKCWAYKQALKTFKKWRLLGNSLSIIFSSGSIASSIATGGIALVAISTVALLIQGWMKHKDLDLKIQNCTYTYQSYQHLLNQIKDMMRSGNFNSSHIYNTMKYTDDFVSDNSPVVDKYLIKYDEIFIH